MECAEYYMPLLLIGWVVLAVPASSIMDIQIGQSRAADLPIQEFDKRTDEIFTAMIFWPIALPYYLIKLYFIGRN